jgi:hypothetical protein
MVLQLHSDCTHTLDLRKPHPPPQHTFPMQYSDSLKTELGYTQSEIDLVSSLTNLGGYCALAAGVLFDRYGPHLPGTIGLLLMSLG